MGAPAGQARIVRAVIPAAGHGTRMHSVTGGGAKELLPLGTTTVIEHVLSEAFSLCDQAIVVWDLDKGDLPLGVGWVPQVPQRGLAPAIASGVSSDDTNLVFLPDAIFKPFDPAGKLASMGEGDIVLALTKVEDEDTRKFGICEVDDQGWVTRMIEKPDPDETGSRWAICGRYKFSGKAAELLIETVTSHPIDGGEMDLSSFFAKATEEGLKIAGCFLEPELQRYDCGDPDDYRAAVEAFRE